jgi:creatinine amidohydrolase
MHHTWKQIERLNPDETVFVIPTGAIEQHGPHLPVDTDIFNANAIAECVGKKTDSMGVVVLPPIWWGTSPHHKGYPGTLSLRLETFYYLLHDLIDSVKSHGFYRFLIINGHGGNAGIISASTSQISYDLGISVASFSYWQSIQDVLIKIGESPIGGMGHACEMETSLALFLRPKLVNLTELRSDLPEQRIAWSCIDFRQPGFLGIPLDFRRDTREGVMGDPLLARIS